MTSIQRILKTRNKAFDLEAKAAIKTQWGWYSHYQSFSPLDRQATLIYRNRPVAVLFSYASPYSSNVETWKVHTHPDFLSFHCLLATSPTRRGAMRKGLNAVHELVDAASGLLVPVFK